MGSKKRNTQKSESGEKELAALKLQLGIGLAEYRVSSEGGRPGMIRQVQIAYEQLRAVLGKEATSLLTPLSSLIAGLVALDTGHTQGFLKAAKTKGGRHRSSIQRSAMQGWLAATFKVLIEEGVAKDAAVSSLEMRLEETGFIAGGHKGLNIRLLRSWQTQAIKNPQMPIGKTYSAVISADLKQHGVRRKDAILKLLESGIRSSRIKDAN